MEIEDGNTKVVRSDLWVDLVPCFTGIGSVVEHGLVGDQVGSFTRELVHHYTQEPLVWVELFPRETLV